MCVCRAAETFGESIDGQAGWYSDHQRCRLWIERVASLFTGAISRRLIVYVYVVGERVLAMVLVEIHECGKQGVVCPEVQERCSSDNPRSSEVCRATTEKRSKGPSGIGEQFVCGIAHVGACVHLDARVSRMTIVGQAECFG